MSAIEDTQDIIFLDRLKRNMNILDAAFQNGQLRLISAEKIPKKQAVRYITMKCKSRESQLPALYNIHHLTNQQENLSNSLQKSGDHYYCVQQEYNPTTDLLYNSVISKKECLTAKQFAGRKVCNNHQEQIHKLNMTDSLNVTNAIAAFYAKMSILNQSTTTQVLCTKIFISMIS